MAVDQKLYVTKHAISHPKDKNALKKKKNKKNKAANDQSSKMKNTEFAIMKQFSVVSYVLTDLISPRVSTLMFSTTQRSCVIWTLKHT